MKLAFFKQDRKMRMRELDLATLEALLEASRVNASPQDTLAELMDIDNRELRGENYAARQAAEAAEQQGCSAQLAETHSPRLELLDEIQTAGDKHPSPMVSPHPSHVHPGASRRTTAKQAEDGTVMELSMADLARMMEASPNAAAVTRRG